MANISQIKLPNGDTHNFIDIVSGYTKNTGTITSIKTTAGTHSVINITSGAVNFNVPTKTSHLTNDSGFITSSTLNNYLLLTGGSVTGPTTFGDTVSIDDLNAGQLVVSGSASFANTINGNIATASALKDSNNGNSITACYSTGGVTDPSYYCAWDGYKITYISKANLKSAINTNTTYSAGTGLSLSSTTFSVKLGYTTSGNNRAVQADSSGNLYVVQKDDNTTYYLQTLTTRQTDADVAWHTNSYIKYLLATSTMTSNKPTFTGDGTAARAMDAEIMHLSWDNNGGWDAQIAINNGGTMLSTRGGAGKEGDVQKWTDWVSYARADHAIDKITRSGTTFTATRADGTTFTFTQQDTTYSSKAAASGGTDVSLVTTGEKYTWNSKTSNTGTITSVKTTAGAHTTINTTSGAVTFNVPTTAAHVSALALSGGTLTGNLTVGTTSQSAAPTGSIHVHDTRSYEIPVTMFDKGVNWFFSNKSMPDSNWWSGMHINGWTGDYNAWELAGPSHNSDQRTSPLYVRSGRTTNGWGSWRKIYDTSNKPTASEVGALALSGGTLTGRLTTADPINQIITGSGTAASDKGSGVSPRYFPAKWTFNTGQTATNGDIITIKIPVAGHTYGVFLSINNGTNYHPVVVGNGTGRLTTHYGNGTPIQLIFDSSGSAADMYALNGADTRATVTGGVWRVLNYYTDGNTYPQAYCSTAAATAAKAASMSGYTATANRYVMIVMTAANTSATALTMNINGTGAKPIYINGSASSTSNYTLPAGSYLVFYNGTNYYFRTDGVDGSAFKQLSASNISSGTLAKERLATSGATAGSYGPSANASPSHGGTFSVPYVTVDTYGRVTAVSTKTITLPADSNTDTKLKLTSKTDNVNYKLALGPGTITSGTAYEGFYYTDLYYNPSTKILTLGPSTTTNNIYMGLATSDALYTAINSLGWVSSVIV